MNPIPIWLGAAVLLGSLAAQDAPAGRPDGKTRLAELQKEQQRIVETWRAAAVAAQKAKAATATSGAPTPAVPMRPDFAALLRTTIASAADYAADEQCSLLVFAFELCSTEAQYGEVLDLLVKDHAKSKVLVELGPTLGYLPQVVGAKKAAEALAVLEREATDPAVVGWLAFGRHGTVLETADPKSEEFQAAKKALLAAVEASGDARLKGVVQSTIVEKETFAIGVTAPDIEGLDLDGVAFKLSDYRGKVVFLDFWGDW
ncbi:MAG: hypothetical protein ABL997_14265 [Planctomycetota bacterium]